MMPMTESATFPIDFSKKIDFGVNYTRKSEKRLPKDDDLKELESSELVQKNECSSDQIKEM